MYDDISIITHLLMWQNFPELAVTCMHSLFSFLYEKLSYTY